MAKLAIMAPVPGGQGVTASLAAGTASAAVTVGQNTIIRISVSSPTSTTPPGLTVTFGGAGGAAPPTPSATVGLLIPIGVGFMDFDMGKNTQFRVFNTGSASVDWSWIELSAI